MILYCDKGLLRTQAPRQRKAWNQRKPGEYLDPGHSCLWTRVNVKGNCELFAAVEVSFMSFDPTKKFHKILLSGSDKIHDPLLRMRLLAFNGTVMAVVSVCSLVFVVFVLFGYYERMPSLMPWLIFFPSLLLLCHLGYFLVARICFLVLAWLGISLGVYLFGREGMVGLYLIPAAMFPFVLFTGREWRWIVLFTGGSIIMFVLLHFAYDSAAAVSLPAQLARFLVIIHTIGAFTMAVLPYILLFYQSELFYREVLRKTEERVHAERLADMGRIAAGTAHEVNNPLTIVHFVLQLLEQDETLQNRPEFIARIHKGYEAIERIKKIVQRLLSLTQSPMDAYEQVALHELPEILSHLFEEQMAEQRIQFIVEQHELGSRVIYGQKGRILEILINLISNAIDAVHDQAEKQIIASFHVDGKDFLVWVQDTGLGIPKDRCETIFTPFYTTKEIGKGTGLGLSSSRSIARHHGGDLICTGGPKGRFILKLPLHSLSSENLSRATAQAS